MSKTTKASPTGTTSKMEQFARLITIEPIMLLCTAANEVSNLIGSNGIFEKLCKERVGAQAGIDCTNRKTMPVAVLQGVQASATAWTTSMHTAVIIVMIIVSPIYGSLSDKHGRKTVMLVSLFGNIAMRFMYLLAISLTDFSLVWLLITYPILTATGVAGAFHTAAGAYLADREPDQSRLTIRYTIVQTIQYIAEVAIGFTLAGTFEMKGISIQMAAVLPIIFDTAAFLYIVAFLVEIPPRLCRKNVIEAAKKGEPVKTLAGPEAEVLLTEKQPESPRQKPEKQNCCVILKLMKEAFATVRKPREGHFRAYICMNLATVFVCTIAGSGGGMVFRLFMLGHPLVWSVAEQSTFYAVQASIKLAGCLLMGVAVKKAFRFHETTLLLFAVGSLVGFYVCLGAAQGEAATALVYLAAVAGFAMPMLPVAWRSLLTQFVEVDETGKLFAIFMILACIGSIIGVVGVNSLFVMTFMLYPGLAFLVVAAMVFLAFCGNLWVHVDYMRYRKSKAATKKEKVELFNL